MRRAAPEVSGGERATGAAADAEHDHDNDEDNENHTPDDDRN
jgi:hypothetical protein